MYVIAPHHSDDYRDANFPLSCCELYNDPWYKDANIHPHSHQVWHCWRDGKLDDDTIIPNMLTMTLIHCPWIDGFREDMNAFFVSNNIVGFAKDEVVDYLEWIDYWKTKDAKFYLSV